MLLGRWTKCPESEIRCAKDVGIGAIFVGNPRQVSNLAAVSFASGTDPATFARLTPTTIITESATNL